MKTCIINVSLLFRLIDSESKLINEKVNINVESDEIMK